MGGASFITCAQAIITQSVGVPVTAKRFVSISRRRSGRVSVSECEAPDCSVSGATTQTSSRQGAGDFLRRNQSRRVDAVIVGDQDAHHVNSPPSA